MCPGRSPRWQSLSAANGGAGNNGARNGVRPSSLLNIPGRGRCVSVTITDWMAAWRRERRVLQRVSRAAWRLEQERERSWALASARAEGVSIRKLAAAAGLSPAGVDQMRRRSRVQAVRRRLIIRQEFHRHRPHRRLASTSDRPQRSNCYKSSGGQRPATSERPVALRRRRAAP